MANIHILKTALDRNIEAKIIDGNNEIELINTTKKIKKNAQYKYISIIPFTSEAIGITIKGMKYALEDHTLKLGSSLGISNEQIENEAEIQIKQGILILIKSKD